MRPSYVGKMFWTWSLKDSDRPRWKRQRFKQWKEYSTGISVKSAGMEIHDEQHFCSFRVSEQNHKQRYIDERHKAYAIFDLPTMFRSLAVWQKHRRHFSACNLYYEHINKLQDISVLKGLFVSQQAMITVRQHFASFSGQVLIYFCIDQLYLFRWENDLNNNYQHIVRMQSLHCPCWSTFLFILLAE